MQNKFTHVVQKIRAHSTLLTLLTLAIVLFSIPLTVVVLQSNQDIRQEASKKKAISIPASKLGSRKYVPGKIKVRLKKNRNASIQATNTITDRIREKAKAKRIIRHEELDIDELDVDLGNEDNAVAELRKDPDVERADRVGAAYALAKPNDSDFSKQYNMELIKASEAWDTTEGDGNIIIAIVDSGIDENHPDLKEKIVAGSKVFHANVDDIADNGGHGTHVAGIAAAVTNNNKGVAGMCPKCKILNVKVLDPNNNTNPGKPAGDNTNIAKGIRYAIDQGAQVINMSFASEVDDPDIREAIEYGFDKGVIFIAGAGNNSSTQKLWPAAYGDKVIAVGAVDANDDKASFSNYGSYVDIAAPGDKIWSTYKDGEYAEMSGTSMASPHIAGLAGLLLSQGLSQSQVREKILNTADTAGKDNKYWQNGRVNAARAVGADDSDPNENEPEPCVTPKEEEDTNDIEENDSGNAPKNKTKEPKTQKTKGEASKKSGSLYERVSQNAQSLRNRFFGGGNSSGNSNAKGEKAARKEARKEAKADKKQAKGRTSVQADDTAEDPCEPEEEPTDEGSKGANKKKSDKEPRPTRAKSIDRTARREAKGKVVRPTRVKNRQIDNASGRDGNEKVITNPGSGGVTKIVERTCEPATVKTPGGVTTVPCDETKIQSVTVLEYNAIIDCFSDKQQPKACTPEKMAQADINNDGKVNQLDYNLFLSQIKQQ